MGWAFKSLRFCHSFRPSGEGTANLLHISGVIQIVRHYNPAAFQVVEEMLQQVSFAVSAGQRSKPPYGLLQRFRLGPLKIGVPNRSCQSW